MPRCTPQLSTSISGFREDPADSFSRRRWIRRRSNDPKTTAMTPAAMQPIVRPVICPVEILFARLCSTSETRAECGFKALATGIERCTSFRASRASAGTIIANRLSATYRTDNQLYGAGLTVNNERGGVVPRSPVATTRPRIHGRSRNCEGFLRRVGRHQVRK